MGEGLPINPNNREIFDRIATGWYNFRHWSIFGRELEALARRWQKGRLLNVGCAHGPDFLPFRGPFELYGVDFSTEMLRLARRYARKFNFTASLSLADATRLPYPDKNFDWAISVATYHHILNEEDRRRAFRELWRVLKPKGEAFITVWNRRQPRFWLRGKHVAVPWHTKGKKLYRQYYLFSYGELEKLAEKADFRVIKSYPESAYRFPLKHFSQNICILLKKGD